MIDADSIHVVFEAECLTEKVSEYLKLLRMIVDEPVFDSQNVSNIFRNYKAEMVEKLMGTPIR